MNLAVPPDERFGGRVRRIDKGVIFFLRVSMASISSRVMPGMSLNVNFLSGSFGCSLEGSLHPKKAAIKSVKTSAEKIMRLLFFNIILTVFL